MPGGDVNTKWLTGGVASGILTGVGLGIPIARLLESGGWELRTPVVQTLSLTLIVLGGAAARSALRTDVRTRDRG